MRCPGDSYTNTSGNLYCLGMAGGQDAMFARGNYALNGGISIQYPPSRPWFPAPNCFNMETVQANGRPEVRIWSCGMGGMNKSFAIDEFVNGSAHFVAIDEIRAGLNEDDSRGAWALGIVGSSLTFGHGLIGDCFAPNAPHPRADDIIGCNQLHEQFGEDTLVDKGMPCCTYVPTPNQATARSMHPGGVHALMLDGSVRFVPDEIDREPVAPNALASVSRCEPSGNRGRPPRYRNER